MILGRFGAAVERDFADRGLDLRQYWRDRRFRTICNIIDGLDDTSHYAAAQAQADDLITDELLDQAEDSPGAALDVRGFDTTTRVLLHLIRVVTDLGAPHLKDYRPPPLPMPETAIQRARAKRVERHQVRTLALIEAAQRRGREAMPEGPSQLQPDR